MFAKHGAFWNRTEHFLGIGEGGPLGLTIHAAQLERWTIKKQKKSNAGRKMALNEDTRD